ncbi:hypothetical protein M501DRAFT_410385 [Patellaria atrata CBS 101060]|uniref:Uncharacterized protein n=1 Tax=Patellaria atrata CBS 101060 TaxID=1346257 RepID=A0A9P4VUV1_9PEZI|nr:hypothetical protein M501DRAFT_410385 [Patellaria atrata CBS 101060]
MCSLYGSEKTHPTMGQDTQYRFELMHAPRLYEFLESTIAPYAWRSSDIISPWHDTVENFGWDEGLKILAQTGLAMQRAQDVPELEKGGVSNFTVIDRFELILANQCMKTGLVPEKFDGQGRYKWRINLRHESLFWLGERFNRDYVNDEPGISNPPSLAQLVKLGDQYHGFTYVPRPDPKGRRPMIYDQDEKKFLLPEPRRLAAEFSPASLALQSVQRISKDWNVMWTSNLAEHLWVDDRIIYVFWCPTLLAHQPR